MFTGIIEGVGRLAARDTLGGDVRFTFNVGTLPFDNVQMGESIAINGVCLTVIAHDATSFQADASTETLGLTTLGQLADGAVINLERAMRPTDRLGGHLVTGHVDGVGEVVKFEPIGESHELVIRAPAAIAGYIAKKGSITVNGVSLTVNRVADLPGGCEISINLIPHTVENTALGTLAQGSRVNLEIDTVARYVERMMSAPTV